MRILFISSSYLPRIGGVEIFTAGLAKCFCQMNYTVKVATQKYPYKLKSREFINGIEVNRFLFFDPQPPRLKSRAIAVYLCTLLLSPFNLLRFIIFLRKFRPDVINYQFVGSPTFFILVYLLFFKTKLVVTVQGEDTRTLPFESKTAMALFKTILKKADFITVNSRDSFNRTLAIAPFAENKLNIIYNGINVKEFHTAESFAYKNGYILSVARLVYKKGLDVLINAFKLITAEAHDIDLIIAGDGPELNNLSLLIKKLGLENKTMLYGWANREEVIKLLNGCEFFVLPSRAEPFGIVLLEAMACKKPVIASRSGGPEEIIEAGVNGLLVSKDDPRQLADAMLSLLKNSELGQKISQNAERTAARFDIKTITGNYLNIFER